MKPYHECPRFDNCGAPKCPLDPEMMSRNRYPGEEKCKAQKPTRYKIGKKYPELLKYQGLTTKEWLGMNMSQEERDRRRVLFLERREKRQSRPQG